MTQGQVEGVFRGVRFSKFLVLKGTPRHPDTLSFWPQIRSAAVLSFLALCHCRRQ